MHAQQIQTGIAGQLDIPPELGRRRIAQCHPRGGQVRTLDVHRLAVDGEDPVLQHHFTEPGAYRPGIAEHIVDRDLDLDIGQLLVAERPRPPKPWIVDVQVPIDLVETACQRLFVLFE